MRFTRIILFTGLLCAFAMAKGQTNISGVINDYVQVTGVNSSCSGCTITSCATVTVASSSAFSVGDRVLLIQMKGAKADTTNTPSHGSILDIQDAGNYEFANIAAISGTDITFEYPLSESYFSGVNPSDSACVQLIRVPVYPGDVTVNGLLESQPWNGITGGVLAFEVEGTLTLQADISVDGQGFKAAKWTQTNSGCTLDTNFYYQSTGWEYTACKTCGYEYDDIPTRHSEIANKQGCNGGSTTCETNNFTSSDRHMAGHRGEGIVANNFTKVLGNGNIAVFNKGKGRWGNGGGGGGNHNSGGGGGGNYGPGGFGGNVFNSFGSGSDCEPIMESIQRGYGGANLPIEISRVFLGGGGGAGHDNGTQGSTGTNGGGIIFIEASEIINGGSFTISANGIDNAVDAVGDGSGGGGAGGSILLDISNGYTNSISIAAFGGTGGDHMYSNCHGTGGGGGGGLIWFSQGSTPANVTTDVNGGANGIQLDPNFDCGDINWGATSGSNGQVNYEGSSPFFNTSPCATATLLPVDLISFTATPEEGEVKLNWKVETEKDNDFFTVERSADGRNFQKVATIRGLNRIEATAYYLTDNAPKDGANYYRLSQTDFNGKRSYLRTLQVKLTLPKAKWNLAPNPVTDHLNISTNTPFSQRGTIQLMDLMGSVVYSETYQFMEGANQAKLDLSNLVKGCFLLTITSIDGTIQLSEKIVIAR